MEEAAELADYLPLSFKTPKEQKHIGFLWDAFETNHTHGKYQFAFLAYSLRSTRLRMRQDQHNEPVASPDAARCR